MRILSWNVNGFRAVLGKGFPEWLAGCGADVVMLQETKAHPDQIPAEHRDPEGWISHWNWSRVKKGYSGTAVFTRRPPLAVDTGLPDERFQGEGRVQRLEFEDFHLLNIYFPNGQMRQERLDFKMAFYDEFLRYAEELRRTKPVVVGGDFNTAHTEIDLKNPKSNAERSGFLPMERAWIDSFIDAGYVDTFRLFTPEPHNYTWWSYRFNARKNNAGWRIDYFFVSEELRNKVTEAWIESDVYGSDHCPIGVDIRP
ncbi:exodeoxyribonuclease-3 [Paucidesulfovibrio gracilis DSM 16080]|uniref:Exodeoxyribonuclease-3 n=1 Tax=Paucidesulfovibrio gracilis DSM 16080 TaxID=1121449 RepID=A0A1T4W711_9BACT|nr:exodeoxyribonuclease III [Paucidesulfovibrio gracilis]SKA72501.1 exodeoxyribonuclease-3 [Paucidesulfovibrio gracilis DSM 16080]